MGKGDKKTRRGKIVKGSYGVLRQKKKKKQGVGARVQDSPAKEKSTVAKAKPAAASKTSRVASKAKEVKAAGASKAEKTVKTKKSTTVKKEKPAEPTA